MSAALRSELLAALESWGLDPADLGDDERPLISAGRLDSLALFNLSVWLEEQLGEPIDPSAFDVMQAWDSVAAILRFVAARGPQGTPAVAAVPAQAPAPAPAPVAAAAAAPRYEIVRYEARYQAGVAQLLSLLWSPDPALTAALFRWKYQDNPFAADPLIYLALHDGQPVAMRAFGGALWEGDAAEPRPVYVADDFIVQEAHRNQGLFQRFTEVALPELARRGQAFFISASALRVTRLQSLASGSRSVGVLPSIARRPAWVVALDWLAERAGRLPLLWRATQRLPIGASAARSFERLDAAAARPARGAGAVIAREARPQAMAELVARLGHDGRIRHRRDAAFFGWRYRHPLHAYRFVYAQRGDALTGYLVLERGLSPTMNPRRVNVVDWACESDAVLGELLAAAIAAGRFAELATWGRTTRPSEPDAFERAGFGPSDPAQAERGLPCILVRETAAAGDSPGEAAARWLDLANWDLRMAYTSYA